MYYMILINFIKTNLTSDLFDLKIQSATGGCTYICRYVQFTSEGGT